MTSENPENNSETMETVHRPPNRDENGRLAPGGGSLNPSGRPRGNAWSTMLQDLAETRKRGGGGKTRQQAILENLLERALTDNAACSLVLDRLEGRPIQKQAILHANEAGEILNAQISFIDPIDTEAITPPPELDSPGNSKE